MNTIDELERLHTLHTRGGLTNEEFSQAKARLLDGSPQSLPPDKGAGNWLEDLHRSPQNYFLGGVCGGLGEHTSIPAWVWRMGWVIAAFCYGVGVLFYILCWIFVPKEAATPAPKKEQKPPKEVKPQRTPFNA